MHGTPPQSKRDAVMSMSSPAASNRPASTEPFAGVREEIQTDAKRKVYKNHSIAAVSEFIGTFLFLWFAFAGTKVAVGTSPAGINAATMNYICMAFGMSLLSCVWVFYRISGGLFNPAVTLALCICGAVPWFRGFVFLFPAQMLGGIVAAALADCMFPGDSSVFQTRLGNGTSIAQGVFIEMFLTSLLILVILMLAVEKHYATFLAPLCIGLAFYTAQLAGVYWTGGSLNPARSFGPDVALTSFPSYHYIYWFGPVMGALLASAYFRFIKAFAYEEVNPGQDAQVAKDHQTKKNGFSGIQSRGSLWRNSRGDEPSPSEPTNPSNAV